MFYTIKFWVRDHYHAWIVKQFKKLPNPYQYRYVSGYLMRQTKKGEGNYFKCLIENFEKLLDKQKETCYNNNVERS